jgi:hypothetical protein
VLYAGNIGAKQSLDVVVEAARQLAGSHRVHFVIAGDGPEKPRLVETCATYAMFISCRCSARLGFWPPRAPIRRLAKPQARPNLRPGGLSFEVCPASRPAKQPRRGPRRRSRLNFLPGRAEAPQSIRPQYILRHSASREISRGNPPRVKPPLSFKGSFGLHWRANCITQDSLARFDRPRLGIGA